MLESTAEVRDEDVNGVGFDEVVVGSEVKAGDFLGGVGLWGGDEDGDGVGCGRGAKFSEQGGTRAIGEREVEDDQVRRRDKGLLETFLGIAGEGDGEAAFGEDAAEGGGEMGFGFDDEDVGLSRPEGWGGERRELIDGSVFGEAGTVGGRE